MKNIIKKIYKVIISKKYAIGIMLGIVAIVILVLFLKIDRDLNQYKIIDEKIYSYFSTEKLEYDTEIILDNKDDITVLKVNGKTEELGSDPLYYTSMDKVVFPKEMSVITPQAKILQKKTPYYSTITKNTDGIFLKNKTLELEVSNKFLFDGDDMYFLLTDAEIKYNDQIINVSPLSYVIYNYNKELYIYNYAQDTMYYVDNLIGEVFAVTKEFTINLSGDSVACGTDEGLLLKNFDYLTNIE